MPQSEAVTRKPARSVAPSKPRSKAQRKLESRQSVALPPGLVKQVERFAAAADTSISKAIATLVRLGLEGQEERKRQFFRRLRENLASDDPKQQDRMVDEFRALLLGQ